MSQRYSMNIFLIAVACIMLAGCAVGPDFRRPDAPAASGYTATALPDATVSAPGTGGAAQRFIPDKEIPALWWQLFQSEALDRVIRQALADSPTMAAAQATLRQAQENLRGRTGAVLLPSLNATAGARRQKISGASFGQEQADNSIFNLFNASVNVSYSLDLFGGGRRELEALASQVNYQRFQLEGAYLSLTANIVTTAVREASLRGQLRATREILAAQEHQLGVVIQQFDLGGISRSEVLAQETQIALTRTALPLLEKELDQTRHQLAVLAGKLPVEAAALPEFDLDAFRLPDELPVSLPSSLVQQRPDIRAAEELLHAAGAQVGVATANLYPQITLSGSYGSEALALHKLFDPGTAVWSLGAGLLQPVFRGGELTAKRRAAIAAYDQAAAQYRSTVLLAFQNVADVLRALDADAQTLKAQSIAEASARENFELAQKQFELGAVSYLTLLNADRQYRQARIGLVQAQAARFADTAALFQALGGGWWNREAPSNQAAENISE